MDRSLRSNMPDDPVEFDDFALTGVGGADESTFFEYDVNISALNTGNNVLAVEVHQVSASSTDVSFDLELLGGTYNTGGSNIYYTLNGSDPRAANGSISPQAINFNGNPLTLDRSTVMKARVKNGTEWSRPERRGVPGRSARGSRVVGDHRDQLQPASAGATVR